MMWLKLLSPLRADGLRVSERGFRGVFKNNFYTPPAPLSIAKTVTQRGFSA